MNENAMKRFWDARAQEDAFFFVDNQLTYGDPDLDRFWAEGEQVVQLGFQLVGSEIRAEDQIVEIGCGLGRVTRALAQRGRSVRAVDISEHMLEKAQELNPDVTNVEWILGDGVTLAGIPDGSADVCFSHVVFQHIPDPNVTLGYVKEMGRVLRPGGRAAFGVSNLPSVHSSPPMRQRARATARALLGRGPRGQSHPAWLGSMVEIDDVKVAAAEAGAPVSQVVGEGTQYCLVLMQK